MKVGVHKVSSDDDEKQEKETPDNEEYYNIPLKKSDSVAERSKELKDIEDEQTKRKKLGREILGKILDDIKKENLDQVIEALKGSLTKKTEKVEFKQKFINVFASKKEEPPTFQHQFIKENKEIQCVPEISETFTNEDCLIIIKKEDPKVIRIGDIDLNTEKKKIFSYNAAKLFKLLEEIFNDAKKRYRESKFSSTVSELSYDHELIVKHIHQTYFVVEIRKIFCGIFDFAKNCKKSKRKESEKNGRTESTTPLIDEDYDSDGSKKEEDCNLDLDKVANFKRVCKVFQKENSNDRVELLRLKGFDELDGQRNNLDLKKLKKDLPKIKKQQKSNKRERQKF
uniref:Uncharacterized protein n=1 Tax=Meloidogyne enterolobii TaxID=390850 RepID=A0A6V7TSQ8_MELEN|nr:unnamed protein product [Meloidogyne enterolobii]